MKRLLLITFALCLACFPALSEAGNAVRLRACSIEATGGRRLWAGLETDGCVTLAFSDDSGRKWTETTFAGRDGMRAASPLLWAAPDGTLWLFYTLTEGWYDGRGLLVARTCSRPSGKSPEWSGERSLGYGFAGGKPFVSGTDILLPFSLWGRGLIGSEENEYANAGWPSVKDNGLYHELDSLRGPGVLLSHDAGSTWEARYGVCTVPSQVPARYETPQILQDAHGRLSMYLRSTGTGWCWKSISIDGGSNWLAPQKFVQNPDRGISFIRLRSGRLLMVRTTRFDNMLYNETEGIFAYLSEDDGRTWYGGLRLSDAPGSDAPSAVELADGRIAVLWNCGDKVLLGFTDEAEIDASTADPLALGRNTRTVFTAGKAASARKEADRPLYAPRRNWSKETLRIGTYNIQYRNAIWEKNRLHAVISLLEQYDFDVFGAQEPFIGQIEDIMKGTEGRYAWVGACIDGKNLSTSAHYNPIFYKKDKFELEDWGVVWFTPKPGEPGYDAYSSRHLCWARLRQKSSGLSFYCFNSHFDHIGAEANRMAARILVKAVRDIAGGMPAFLTGDFNSDEKSVPYGIILSEQWLFDSLDAVSDPVNAEYFSMSRYKPMSTVKKSHLHIDHIFFTPNSSRVLSWKLITDSYDGDFGSDHLPIIVEWKIAN